MEAIGVEKVRFFSPSPVPDVFVLPERKLLWDRASMSLGVWDDDHSSEDIQEMMCRDSINDECGHAVQEWVKQERALYPLGPAWNAESHVQGITIHASQICNLACRYCAAGGDGTYGNPGRLVTESAFVALDNLFASSLTSSQVRITFSGGEPLLYTSDLMNLCEKLTDLAQQSGKEIRWAVVTNGTQWRESSLTLVTRYQMDVSISIDGPPSVQNQRRPSKTGQAYDWNTALDQFFEYIRAARNHGYRGKITASSVFDRYHTDVQGALRYLSQWDFDYFDWTWNYFEKDPRALRAFEQSYFAAMAELWQAGGEKSLRKILAIDRIYRALDGKNPLNHYCGAGLNHLTMNRKGDWSVCPWLAEDPAYRVSLEQRSLWSSAGSAKQPDCASCWAKPLCGGGCRFMHLQGNSSSFCYWTQSLIQQVFEYYRMGEVSL